MLLKCCTQWASKYGKLGNGHKTGKCQVSFQFQRRQMSKSVQTTIQLHSFHTLAMLCSKLFKLDFSSTWTKNFQMYKLGFEEAEEPEIKWPTFIGSWREQGSFWETSTFPLLNTLKLLTVWIITNCGKFLKMYQITLFVSWETETSINGSRSNS